MNTSRHTFSLIIFLSIYLISAETLPSQETSGQSKVEKLIQEGKDLYENGEYKEAIIRFLEGLTEAQSNREFSEIYFNLSLGYYADGQAAKAKNYLQKLFEIQPDKAIDERYFPTGFVRIFNQEKSKPEAGMKTEKKASQTVKEGDLISISLADTPPVLVKKVSPTYPPVALRTRAEGKVIVNALISETGDVIKTEILQGIKGPYGFNRAAQKAVEQWKFRPAIKEGKKVKVWKPVTIVFKKE
ncbi:MAG: TonB family protein [Candidatus Aminicenantaceae bacterium]